MAATTLAVLVERAWEQAALGDDEQTAKLFWDSISTWEADCRKDLGAEVAASPDRHLLQKTFDDIAISAGGRLSLNRADLETMLRAGIEHVDHVSGGGVVTRMRRVRPEHQFDYPQRKPWLWWTLRDGEIVTIDASGRRTPASTLAGSFRLHASFIPTIANLDNYPALQDRFVELLAERARAKFSVQLARDAGEVRRSMRRV